MADIYKKLALLTDPQSYHVLNRIIAGYAARNPDFPVDDANALAQILSKIARETGEPVSPRTDDELRDRAVAVRALLVQLAESPRQSLFVAGAIEYSREVLVEPITTALVVAGIILLLDTEFDVKVSRSAGKTEY